MDEPAPSEGFEGMVISVLCVLPGMGRGCLAACVPEDGDVCYPGRWFTREAPRASGAALACSAGLPSFVCERDPGRPVEVAK